MSEQLFIRMRGRIQGPLSLDQIQNLVRRGQFGRLHEVSDDGMQWVRASNYPQLFVKTAAPESSGATPTERSNSPAGNRNVTQETSYAIADGAQPTVSGSHPAAEGGKLWYYATETDEQVGPIDQADLIDLVRVGKVAEATRVWSQGLADWQPLCEVAELASVLFPARSLRAGSARASEAGRVPQLSQEGFRTLVMTRPWVFFLSLLLWLFVAASLVGTIVLFIQAGKLESSFLLTQAIAASVSTGLYAALAALLLAFANRINTLVIERTQESLDRVLLAQCHIWRFLGIATAACIIAGLLLAAFLMILGAAVV